MLTTEQVEDVRITAEREYPNVINIEGFLASAKNERFGTFFGRDALVDSILTLEIYSACPEKVELLEPIHDSLTTMAKSQGAVVDNWRDEEPGKISHELRQDKDPVNAVNQGLLKSQKKAGWPVDVDEKTGLLSMRYYGSIDATPLFINVACKYLMITKDTDFFRFLDPHIRAAIKWIEEYGDCDGDGFIEFSAKNRYALLNHGWKDAGDSIKDDTGQRPKEPIALVEVQGYAYQAYMGAAAWYDYIDGEFADELREKAIKLKEKFNQDFWVDDEGFFAYALDGDKKQVTDITSNVGHLLMTGIIDADKLPRAVARLMQPDMLTLYGIRPLSSKSPNFSDVEPQAYHNGGGVWAHDNALVYLGLKKSGLYKEAGMVRDRVLEAAYVLKDVYDVRNSELYMVDRNNQIRPYIGAVSPQSWVIVAYILMADPLEVNKLNDLSGNFAA